MEEELAMISLTRISENYSNMGNTLCLGALIGNLDLVKQHVEAGVNINWTNESGYSPIIWSAREGHFLIVRYLLENGANVHSRNESGTDALIFACKYNHHDVASLLLDYNADTSIVSNSWGTAQENAYIHGWNLNEMQIQSYYRSPLYFDHVFCCAIEIPKLVEKSKKRKRALKKEEVESEAEKPFMQKFMERVVHADLIFVHRVLPYLFCPYDP